MSEQPAANHTVPAAKGAARKPVVQTRSIRVIKQATMSIEDQIRELQEKHKALRAEKARAIDKAMREAMKPLERKIVALVRADADSDRFLDRAMSSGDLDDLAQQFVEILGRSAQGAALESDDPDKGEEQDDAQGGQDGQAGASSTDRENDRQQGAEIEGRGTGQSTGSGVNPGAGQGAGNDDSGPARRRGLFGGRA